MSFQKEKSILIFFFATFFANSHQREHM